MLKIVLLICAVCSVSSDSSSSDFFEEFGCVPNTNGDQSSWFVQLEETNPEGDKTVFCSGTLISRKCFFY